MDLSNVFLRLAVLFAIVGIALGAFMGGSGDHTLVGVHAHINLLGWVSMFLYGLFYRSLPGAAQGLLPTIHFWVAALGVLIFTPALAVVLLNLTSLMVVAEIGLMTGPLLVMLGMILFAVIVFRATGKTQTVTV
jgi:cbb3-type cytochrome oxidase subunit 1